MIVSFLSSIFAGGVTGLLGVVAQRFADYKNKQLDIELNQQKQDHEIAMRKVDAEIMAQEWAAKTKVAEVETAGRSDVADSQAFAASFNEPVRYADQVKPSQGQGWMLVILDFIRGTVRPGLTVYLCAITTVIYFQAHTLIGNGLTADKAYALTDLIVRTILYLTTTCCLWWFGTRNKQKAPGG